MRVDVAEAGKALCRGANVLLLWKEKLLCLAHHHLLDVSPSVDEDSDLSADFPGDLGEVTGEFGCQDLIEGESPPVDPFDVLDLAGLQTQRIAEDSLDVRPPRSKKRMRPSFSLYDSIGGM